MDAPARRKRRWPWILVILFVLFFVTIGGAILALSRIGSKSATVKPGSVLEVRLGGEFSEGPREDLLSELTGVKGTSVWSLRKALRAAAKDERIGGVLVSIQSTYIGWGAAEEILGEFDRFRESGKPVYALLQSDFIQDLGYFLATCADQIWVTPEAGVMVNGLVSEVAFYRGTLEKLHIEPEVIMYKEYKSAGEPFLNREMSPYMREALTELLKSFDSRFTQRVTGRRQGVAAETLKEFLSRGVATSDDLKRLNLVDRIGYVDELHGAFKEVSTSGEYEEISLSDYLSAARIRESTETEKIAVVFGEGLILSEDPGGGLFGYGDWIIGPALAEDIRDAADDKDVKAIVFRVNSPGGSAVGSDLIRREIEAAKEKGKKVVVSMSSVAGSGGYWISMDADALVAQPCTITGSIGVVFTKFNLTGFMDWIGTNINSVSTGPLADILGTPPLDEQRKKVVMVWLDKIYNSFVERAAKGRHLSPDALEPLAHGRIWSGEDALERGLIDRLGGFDDAVALAKEKAGLDTSREYPLVIFPKPKSFLQRLIEGDLSVQTPQVPTETEILDLVREITAPQVMVRMPDILIH